MKSPWRKLRRMTQATFMSAQKSPPIHMKCTSIFGLSVLKTFKVSCTHIGPQAVATDVDATCN